MWRRHRKRLITTIVLSILVLGYQLLTQPLSNEIPIQVEKDVASEVTGDVDDLEIKGRAPKTGYSRTQFSDGWKIIDGCSVRERILTRDLVSRTTDNECTVLSGVLHDPYSGRTVSFTRGRETSDDVQIDHVIALSNAWQTGAQQLTSTQRDRFSNDPLNLLAVDGSLNQQKSDGDAATWLPPNKSFRCSYIQRQVKVKLKYDLWTTPPENKAMRLVLSQC